MTILLVQKFQVSSIVCKDQLCGDRMAALLRHLTSVLKLSMRTKTGIPRFVHSRPQSPRSFWSAPRIETSGRGQVRRKRNSCPFL